ncbi:MAG: flagellar type III secretion system pore protein FliP [Desulfobacteraceae bacterium]|nr:flagellar type III secretion system pore protein FliP [Desulfobacteraceae bacterium]MBU4001261.1 flagellar type III secretion system pore protein FliP [Pseudomonadota bacterium]MBU4054953.1 flagellar type III secretion system pore protein FliP [Pseudomonadota bacterium]
MTLKTFKIHWILLVILFIGLPGLCQAQDNPVKNSIFSLDLNQGENDGKLSVVVEIFILMTVLTLAPAILVMVTSFTRIVIVLSILRQALGTQQTPPNQIIIGLALFLTLFIMAPVWENINENALQPYMQKTISQEQAFDKAIQPLRTFMVKQTREKDIAMLIQISKTERPKNINDVPTTILIPAFIISELKTAFQMGFLLYIPFLILDMVISSILLSMGMMMLPPVMISLPFKLMLFVLADGWHLIAGSMIKSFG